MNVTIESNAIIEAAARAMCNRHFPGKWDAVSNASHEWFRDLARSSLAAVTPLIEANALERAATVAEDYPIYAAPEAPRNIAAAIRALKEQP